MLQDHFDTVRAANGQPLNDKRNGAATLRKWDRQNEALRRQKESIQKTEAAIEREKGKIIDTEYVRGMLPDEIVALIADGTLKQWRKHPHILFVDGVEKARMIWKDGKLYHKYAGSIPTKEQHRKFAAIYNDLNSKINA